MYDRDALIEHAVTQIVQSPDNSNRRVTKKTPQLQLNHKVQPESSH